MVHRRKGLTKIMTLYRIGMFTSVSSFGIQQIKNTIRVILGAYYFFIEFDSYGWSIVELWQQLKYILSVLIQFELVGTFPLLIV